MFSACSGENTNNRIPDTQPDIQGPISKLKRTAAKNGKSVATILVETVGGIESNYPKATITVDEKTIIQDQEGTILKPTHLREGLTAEVWFDEPVLESLPVQAHAAAVRITVE
ncbi:DUF3221 domain-containing protein [Pontibacter sp. SGAir0037]|nr:DUF3221 domain-containing protein [Pontibacter sp. SGAir0037]